jgi:hypothetical protein
MKTLDEAIDCIIAITITDRYRYEMGGGLLFSSTGEREQIRIVSKLYDEPEASIQSRVSAATHLTFAEVREFVLKEKVSV